MKSELFKIGPFTVYGYGFLIAIGIICAYLLTEYRAKKQSIRSDVVFALILWCLFGGILGSKVLYWITDLKALIANPQNILLSLTEGFVVYGAILGGITAAALFCYKNRLSLLQSLDLLIPSVSLAQGFGRIGCFLAGCCYGKETSGAFAVVFRESVYAPNGIPLIPTQIVSSVLDFLNTVFLLWIARHVSERGSVTGVYLVTYSIGRFLLEYLRGDLERGSVGMFSTSQFISLFTVMAGVVLLLRVFNRNSRLNRKV